MNDPLPGLMLLRESDKQKRRIISAGGVAKYHEVTIASQFDPPLVVGGVSHLTHTTGAVTWPQRDYRHVNYRRLNFTPAVGVQDPSMQFATALVFFMHALGIYPSTSDNADMDWRPMRDDLYLVRDGGLWPPATPYPSMHSDPGSGRTPDAHLALDLFNTYWDSDVKLRTQTWT